MSLDFQKIDASLFAIEGFLLRLNSHGDNLEHLEFYMVMASELRKIIRANRPPVAAPLSRPDEPKQPRRVRGPMPKEQKKKISNTMKRRHKQKMEGKMIKKKFSRSHRKNISVSLKKVWAHQREMAKKLKTTKKGKR